MVNCSLGCPAQQYQPLKKFAGLGSSAVIGMSDCKASDALLRGSLCTGPYGLGSSRRRSSWRTHYEVYRASSGSSPCSAQDAQVGKANLGDPDSAAV